MSDRRKERQKYGTVGCRTNAVRRKAQTEKDREGEQKGSEEYQTGAIDKEM